jgi:hypothetical protein
MKFFVLAVQGASEAQRNAITQYLRDNGYGFWHWLADFWIVQTTTPDLQAPAFRDVIKQFLPGLVFNVFAIRPINNDWAGFGDHRSVEWLKENWKDS